MVNLDIYVDTSTSLGVGLCVGNCWVAWRLVPGWNSGGCDIGWEEAVALELAAMWLAETDQHDVCVVIRLDNKGVIDAFNKGRSRNLHHNDCLGRISLLLAISNTSVIPVFIPSRLNKADSLSCGILGSSEHHLLPSLILVLNYPHSLSLPDVYRGALKWIYGVTFIF